MSSWTFCRRFVAAAAAVLSVYAVTATSCDRGSGVAALTSDGSVVWVSTGFRFLVGQTTPEQFEATEELWSRSDDGGLTWVSSEPPPASLVRAYNKEACLSDGSCVRSVFNSHVERQARGEPWEVAWGFSAADRETLDLNAADSCNGGPSLFAGVVKVRGPDGEHVVVDMGAQGVLVRTTDGSWQQVAVAEFGPTVTGTTNPQTRKAALSSRNRLGRIAVIIWGAAAFGCGLLALLAIGHPRRRALAAAVIGGAVLVAAIPVIGIVSFFGGEVPPNAWIVASCGVFALSLTLALSQRSEVPPPVGPPPWPNNPSRWFPPGGGNPLPPPLPPRTDSWGERPGQDQHDAL
jgi:hypothetical protein